MGIEDKGSKFALARRRLTRVVIKQVGAKAIFIDLQEEVLMHH
jgi:hypothetical protein